MKIKITLIILTVLLLVSFYYNMKPDKTRDISFLDANTRPTFDHYHSITKAQEKATGKGIKVGILGKYFGYNHTTIYEGGKNFTGDKASFEEVAEHGLWMSTTLKEIAPDVEIYALGVRESDRYKEAGNISRAIEWAIKNDIDILTYSAESFRAEDRKIIDTAVQKAIKNNIVAVFIHYDLEENILPTGFYPKTPEPYAREADVNVFHFDYNHMLMDKYKNYLKSNRETGNNIGAHPYFSNSSMSQVIAGILAMMKEVNNQLTPEEYKAILIATSKEIEYNEYKVSRVVDALAAINFLAENRQH